MQMTPVKPQMPSIFEELGNNLLVLRLATAIHVVKLIYD